MFMNARGSLLLANSGGTGNGALREGEGVPLNTQTTQGPQPPQPAAQQSTANTLPQNLEIYMGNLFNYRK